MANPMYEKNYFIRSVYAAIYDKKKDEDMQKLM